MVRQRPRAIDRRRNSIVLCVNGRSSIGRLHSPHNDGDDHLTPCTHLMASATEHTNLSTNTSHRVCGSLLTLIGLLLTLALVAPVTADAQPATADWTVLLHLSGVAHGGQFEGVLAPRLIRPPEFRFDACDPGADGRSHSRTEHPT
jgi:hypothetical protein